MLAPEIVACFFAAVGGGALNAIAGGGTLLTFPTLLALGIDARIANATSTVALWPGALGAAWGYRREMAGSRALWWRLFPASVLGGLTGALLLLWTPRGVFERLVPYLILLATLLFVLQGRVVRFLRPGHTPGAGARWGALGAQYLVSVYGGYFGAGLGILLLTILGLLGVSDIHRANGLKAVLGMSVNGAAIIGFLASGLVSWPHALVMLGGAILGGYLGAGVARRLGRTFARWAVVAIGLGLGVFLLVKGV